MLLTLRMGLGYFVVISAFVTIGGVVFAEGKYYRKFNNESNYWIKSVCQTV